MHHHTFLTHCVLWHLANPVDGCKNSVIRCFMAPWTVPWCIRVSPRSLRNLYAARMAWCAASFSIWAWYQTWRTWEEQCVCLFLYNREHGRPKREGFGEAQKENHDLRRRGGSREAQRHSRHSQRAGEGERAETRHIRE